MGWAYYTSIHNSLPGNDLARALNWGGGYTGEKVMQLLLAIEDANTVSLDRSGKKTHH